MVAIQQWISTFCSFLRTKSVGEDTLNTGVRGSRDVTIPSSIRPYLGNSGKMLDKFEYTWGRFY